MADIMQHRGPDDAGIVELGPVALVNRRLAIVDLTEAGHQPMVSADGQVALTYNGETYNHPELRRELLALGHRFMSRTDTEVVLHAYLEWGAGCFQHLRGMFAAAIWDGRRGVLVLARDRVGIKPLYYATTGDQLVFGSEIKVLRCHPAVGRRARPVAIAQYMAFTHPIDDETWFEGVKRLGPGCYAQIRPGGQVHITRYWDPVPFYRERRHDTSALAEEMSALLDESVRQHMCSDVPMGAHLSGGLDSSTVVALLSRHSPTPVRTFSGAFSIAPRYDESEYINIASRAFNTVHRQVFPTSGDFRRRLPELLWHLDEPTVGPSAFGQLEVCRLVRESGVAVVHGGQGGDELFGGYPRYLLHRSPISVAGWRNWTSSAVLKAHVRRRMYDGRFGRLVTGVHGDLAIALRGYRPVRPRYLPEDPVADQMVFDLKHYLPALLHVEDRTSMAMSIESRVPLVDHRIVELAAAIPADVKMANGRLKGFLRDVVADVVPAAIANRTDKKGFPTPLGLWLRGDAYQWAHDTLTGRRFADRRVISQRHLRVLLAAHHRGVLWATHPLWTALSIAVWFDAFDVDVAW